MTTKGTLLGVVLAGTIGAWVAAPVAADSHTADEEEFDVHEFLDSLAFPGPDHSRLDAIEGEWTTAITVWEDVDAEPEKLTGTSVRKWVLDGRFMEEMATNDNEDEDAFEGRGYIGYNRLTDLYEYAWMTNATTGMFIERGRYDPGDNVLRTRGYDTDPLGGTIILSNTELKIESPDKHVVTSYSTGADGRAWKQLEVVYTRKK